MEKKLIFRLVPPLCLKTCPKIVSRNASRFNAWNIQTFDVVNFTLRCGVMGGFSQMSAISELLVRTKRLRTMCFTNGSKSRNPRLRTADRMAQKVKPENEIKIFVLNCSSSKPKDKFAGSSRKNGVTTFPLSSWYPSNTVKLV